nr:hypothetical protein [Mucilaginibacter sp. SP1R1]
MHFICIDFALEHSHLPLLKLNTKKPNQEGAMLKDMSYMICSSTASVIRSAAKSNYIVSTRINMFNHLLD